MGGQPARPAEIKATLVEPSSSAPDADAAGEEVVITVHPIDPNRRGQTRPAIASPALPVAQPVTSEQTVQSPLLNELPPPGPVPTARHPAGNTHAAPPLPSPTASHESQVKDQKKKKKRKSAESKPTNLKSKSSRWTPVVMTLGFVLVILLGVFLFLSSFPRGQSFLASINPLSSSPERLAQRLNNVFDRYVDILKTASPQSDRQAEIRDLEELESEIVDIAFAAGTMFEIDDLRYKTLVDLVYTGNDVQLQATGIARDLEPNTQRELRDLIESIQSGSNAAQALITQFVKTPTEPSTDDQRVCYEGLMLERKIVRCLAMIHDDASMEESLSRIQVFVDKLNEIAERQSQQGGRVGFRPRDYEGIEDGGETARNWFIDYLEEQFPNHLAFQATIRDLAFVEQRFDQALYVSSIAILESSSRARIQDALAGNSPYEAILSGQSMADSVVTDSAMTDSTTEETTLAGEGAKPSMQNPGPSDRPSPGRTADGADASVAAENAPGDEPDPVSESKDPHGESSAEPTVMLQGPNSATIVCVDAQDLDPEKILNSITRSVGSSDKSYRWSGTGFILNFRYSGSLENLVPQINFGQVDIVDEQSRTIFVDADD